MKTNNLIALSLGLICAGLLWQYYLYPKYSKKVQDPQAMQELLAADSRALDEEIAKNPGELLYRTDILPADAPANQNIVYREDPSLQKETITLIEAPAKYTLIKTLEQYKKVKDNIDFTDKIDFSKEMLILLESAGNLSNSFYQIKDIKNTGKEILVSYTFNLIGAKEREGKTSAKKTAKSALPVVLEQVL